MKFFWKIFFAIMFTSISCFSVGGCILVRSNFDSLMQNEVDAAYEIGEITYFSLSRDLLDIREAYRTEISSDDAIMEQLQIVANSISIQNTGGEIRFAILNAQKQVVFSSLKNNFDASQFENLSDGEKGYAINKNENGYYLNTIRPAAFGGVPCYIGTTRDVTFIFQNQYQQYKLLVYIMATMILFVSILTFAISKLLIRKIISLNTTVMEISSGKISERVEVKGEDEVTLLSQNFNKMADELERNIHTLEEQAEKQELFVAAFSH
ncbi:MAG: HAMP domain-containing protein, partial [Oscillospiraceae bacterium]